MFGQACASHRLTGYGKGWQQPDPKVDRCSEPLGGLREQSNGHGEEQRYIVCLFGTLLTTLSRVMIT